MLFWRLFFLLLFIHLEMVTGSLLMKVDGKIIYLLLPETNSVMFPFDYQWSLYSSRNSNFIL